MTSYVSTREVFFFKYFYAILKIVGQIFGMRRYASYICYMRRKKKYIYGLFDPFNGKIFYIGQSVDLNVRLAAHVNGNNNKAKSEYIKAMKQKPEIITLYECSKEDDPDLKEIEFINKYRKEGHYLFNAPVCEERKRPTNITISPSLWKKAKEKAISEKTSLSGVIENYLMKYIMIFLIILFLTSCATQNSCQQNRNFIGYHSK